MNNVFENFLNLTIFHSVYIAEDYCKLSLFENENDDTLGLMIKLPKELKNEASTIKMDDHESDANFKSSNFDEYKESEIMKQSESVQINHDSASLESNQNSNSN